MAVVQQCMASCFLTALLQRQWGGILHLTRKAQRPEGGRTDWGQDTKNNIPMKVRSVMTITDQDIQLVPQIEARQHP